MVGTIGAGGIGDMSIGLENIDDIIEDLESGFKALRESGLAK